MGVRRREQQHGNPQLVRHFAPQVLRNDAAQIERHDRQPGVARREHQRFGEQRIVRAIRRTALAIRIAVHRAERGRRDVDFGQARFEVCSIRGVQVERETAIKRPGMISFMRSILLQRLRALACNRKASGNRIDQCDNISRAHALPIVQVDAFTAKPVCRQSGGGVRSALSARRSLDAECGARDESFGNRIPGAPGRWLQFALVHPGCRSGSLRPCHARQRARALGRRPSEAGRTGALSHAQRIAHRRQAGRLDRNGFSGQGR